MDGLPKALALVAKADPLSYGVEWGKGALIGVSHFGILTDFVVLSIITSLILVLGIYLFSKIQI